MILTDMKSRASRSAETREKSRRDKESGADKSSKYSKSHKKREAVNVRKETYVRKSSANKYNQRHSANTTVLGDKFRFALNVFLKFSIVVSVAGIVGVAIYFGKNFVDDASSRPVTSMSIQGDFTFLTQKEVSQIVLPLIDNGFLRLPLSGIKGLLEKNPWIDSASVSRRWPDKLAVSVVEQHPIARWGDKGYLNQRGEFIAIKLDDQLSGLPMLSGNVGQEKLIMQDYQQLAQLLGSFGLTISEFYCDELMSRKVVLDNNLVVNIGRDQLVEKIQRFLSVYNASLKTQLNEIATIDLRYGNGVAVEWVSLEERIERELSDALSIKKVTSKDALTKKNNKA